MSHFSLIKARSHCFISWSICKTLLGIQCIPVCKNTLLSASSGCVFVVQSPPGHWGAMAFFEGMTAPSVRTGDCTWNLIPAQKECKHSCSCIPDTATWLPHKWGFFELRPLKRSGKEVGSRALRCPIDGTCFMKCPGIHFVSVTTTLAFFSCAADVPECPTLNQDTQGRGTAQEAEVLLAGRTSRTLCHPLL